MRPLDQIERGERVPVLDGLRAVACLLVILHHCGRGGPGASLAVALYNRVSASAWVGVDLFFVLSGFLITGLLLDARERAGGLRRFWERRALRILPLAYVFLAVVFFSPLWRAAPWHAAVRAEQAWFWLYANNWLALTAPGLDPGVLGHFWSLAIEEQFYLCWPLVVLFVPAARLRMVCAILLAASAAGHGLAAAFHVGTTLVYDLTPWRLDGILLGSWLAVGLRRDGWLRLPPLSLSHRGLALAAGAVAVALLWPARGLPAGDPWVRAAGSAGAAVTFTLLLWAALLSPQGALARRLLEARPLAALGRISYGLYVLHFPIVLALRAVWPAPDGSLRDCLAFFAATVALSAVAATLSWFSLERPMLRLRPRT
jgi:peptidoglycan/LPS O-acetylase OafA/YrhL